VRDGDVMKYFLPKQELNNWKGRLAERIVQLYIRDELIPRLKSQGWDEVIFSRETWFDEWMSLGKPEERFFISNGLFPDEEFLLSFQRLTKQLLSNAPDGFLVKLKKTPGVKTLDHALKELGLEGSSWNWGSYSFEPSQHDKREKLPVVGGEIEVVEVKCGKSIIPPHQKKSYTNVVSGGHKVRFFNVVIRSLDKNDFELAEKVITNPRYLKTFPAR
jgi:hypothetical protein